MAFHVPEHLHDFTVGQRVRLSELGREHLKYHPPTDRGVITKIADGVSGHTYLMIMRDGYKKPGSWQPAAFWDIESEEGSHELCEL